MKRKSSGTKKRAASRLRGLSDELGITAPRKRRSSAGKKRAPRARPRRTR